jgi:hypothetical protein
VFSKPEVQKWFKPYLIVQLYTDIVPAEFYAPPIASDVRRREADAQDINVAFMQRAFDSLQLPLYVILEPTADGRVDVVGAYAEGRIMDEPAFIEFLKNPK